jgi:hypothetical protein
MSTLTAVNEHRLFGPPPLLQGEDAAAYEEFYGRVCAALNQPMSSRRCSWRI